MLVCVLKCRMRETSSGSVNEPAGELVDHLGAMGGMASPLFSLLRMLFGGQGAQYFAMYGGHMLYVLYWWAIPIAKMLFGM